MLAPIKLPPGYVISGTSYQSKGYWINGNLVRFFERSIRPVGGWELIVTLGGIARGMHAWRSNDAKARLIIGTSDSVQAYTEGNIVDITPGTFGAAAPPPPPPSYTPSVYGAGLYGDGFYGRGAAATPGSGPTDTSIPLVADDDATWVFDNFGELPVGVMSSDGNIRSWDLVDSDNFEVIDPLAPQCRAVVVTPERFLMALGASARSQGYLVFSDQPADADTVTVGSMIYIFKTTITSAANDVLIGATVEDTITNLAAAINQSAGGAGSIYGDATVFNPDFVATADTGSLTLIVSARVSGVAGDGFTLVGGTNYVWTADVTEGGKGSPAAVRWASRETLDDWVPTKDNTAGDDQLSSVGRAMNGKRMPRETLIWTDTDLHSAVYIGGELLYTFEWRGDKCGALAPNSMAVVGDVAYWMSDNGFFLYNGAVSPIPCDVHDYVFSRLNKEKAQRAYAVSKSSFGEVWWYYPSLGSDDVDSYVAYNYKEKHWAIGSLGRSSGVDRGVFITPIEADIDGNLWKSETGNVRSGADPVFLESGPVEIEEGNNVWMVRRLVPDEKNLGQVHVYVGATFNPTDAVIFAGPYNPLQPTSLRQTGRQIRFRLTESAANQDFRVGVFRVDAIAAGER